MQAGGEEGEIEGQERSTGLSHPPPCAAPPLAAEEAGHALERLACCPGGRCPAELLWGPKGCVLVQKGAKRPEGRRQGGPKLMLRASCGWPLPGWPGQL